MSKEKVTFWAKKSVPKRVRISFRTSTGEKVSFTANRKIKKMKRVSFWAKSR